MTDPVCDFPGCKPKSSVERIIRIHGNLEKGIWTCQEHYPIVENALLRFLRTCPVDKEPKE